MTMPTPPPIAPSTGTPEPPLTVVPEQDRRVPFFRPAIGQAEIDEVVAVLQSGWLTTGPRVARFEAEFARAVGARHAVALNSCTAALHLAVEALGLADGQAVLVPTMTFAATAEIVRYRNAQPILVDCDPVTGNMDIADAERKLRRQRLDPSAPRITGILPVHVAGLMLDVQKVRRLAAEFDCWVVEDAAHAFPAAWRRDLSASWQRCGESTADVTCFSFYANKTITTGEGGIAVTNDARLAERMRMMSLHGLSHDAWGRYSGSGPWDYQIVEAGFKYNLTDIAAAIGIHQLARAESLRARREELAGLYRRHLHHIEAIDLPPDPLNRIHAWHLFPIRLRLDHLRITRNQFITLLQDARIGCSVHWRPLHLHPLYIETYGFKPEDLPVATRLFERTVTLPLFPTMAAEDIQYVCGTIARILAEHRR